jgi:hypothetical protein
MSDGATSSADCSTNTKPQREDGVCAPHGVDGSSPSEGSAKAPQCRTFLFRHICAMANVLPGMKPCMEHSNPERGDSLRATRPLRSNREAYPETTVLGTTDEPPIDALSTSTRRSRLAAVDGDPTTSVARGCCVSGQLVDRDSRSRCSARKLERRRAQRSRSSSHGSCPPETASKRPRGISAVLALPSAIGW